VDREVSCKEEGEGREEEEEEEGTRRNGVTRRKTVEDLYTPA
jgi:hypothetical protein